MDNSGGIEVKITPRRPTVPQVPTLRNYSGPPLRTGFVKKPQQAPEDSSGKSADGFFVRIFDGIITFSLAALFFGVPIFFLGSTFQGIIFEKYMYFFFFLLLGVVAWATKSVISGELRLRRTPLDLPLLVFWSVMLLSTAFSMDRWHSFFGSFGDLSRGFLAVTGFIFFYYLLVTHFTMARFRWLFGAFVASGSIVIIWTLLALLGVRFLPGPILSYAPISLFGTVTSTALFLGMMLPILCTAIFAISRKIVISVFFAIARIVLTLLVAVDIAALFILYGYVSWTPLFAGLSIFLLFVLARIVRPSQRWSFVPMLAFVGVLAVFMIGQKQMARVPLPDEVSPNARLSWEIARGGLKENPIIGSGIGTYGYVFSQHRPQSFNNDPLFMLRFNQGSNLLFEFVPTVGVVGSVSFVFLVVSFVSVGLYLLSREKEKNKILSLGAWSSSFMFIVALFSAPVGGATLLAGIMLSTLALALLLEESQTEKRSTISLSLSASPKYALSIAFLFIVISAGVVYLFVSLGKILVADTYAGQVLRAKEVSEEGTIKRLLTAIGIHPLEGRYYMRLAQEYMSLANAEALKKEGDAKYDTAKIQDYLRFSLAAAQQGTMRLPKDIQAQVTLAEIYDNASLFVADAPMKAEEAYVKATEIEPTNPVYHMKVGQVKLAQARLKEGEDEKKAIIESSREHFQKSVDLKENFSPGYYYLSVVKENLGDVSGAIDEMLKAVRYEQNIDNLFNLARLYQGRNEGSDMEYAEGIYRSILASDDKNIYAHMNLALLYDKLKQKDGALEEYGKVLELLPAEGSDDARKNIETMMENVRNGVSNEGQIPEQVSQPAPAPEIDSEETNQP